MREYASVAVAALRADLMQPLAFAAARIAQAWWNVRNIRASCEVFIADSAAHTTSISLGRITA